METIIYLTRHGQTEWNIEKRLQGRKNSPLTKNGIERAKELSIRMKEVKIDKLYSSPIERALETANIIKGKKNIEIILEDGLIEMNFGDYEGKLVEQVRKENPKWDIDLIMMGNTDLSAPNGENLNEVRNRVKITMDRLLRENKGKTLMIVTHGITLKCLLYYFNDSNINTEVMGQATLTKIVIDDKKVNIEFKNDDSHFSVKNEKLGW